MCFIWLKHRRFILEWIRVFEWIEWVVSMTHLLCSWTKSAFWTNLLNWWLYSLFHTEIPKITRVMCSGNHPGIVWFWFIHTASDFPESVRAFTHTTHKDPVKTRDISCDVYNAPRTISLNWRTISSSAQIVRSSLIAASFQFTHFSSWTLICLQNNR